jgi:hypothetical protein
MLFLSSACAVKCDLLNPNACGLYDCGGNSWSPDETVGNGDNLSLRSGQVNMIGSSKVCMNARGPGLVRFVWKVDPTDQHVGMLSFWVDDAQAAVCNSQGWSPVSYSLREGKDYELAWQFLKTQSYPEGAGAGWIDDLDVSNAALYSDDLVCQINKSYSNQTISLEKPPNAENTYDLIQNPQRGISTTDGIFISSSNVTIIVPNLSINVAQCPRVAINISDLNANLDNANQASSINDTEQKGNTDMNKPMVAIVGKCNCSFGNESKRYESIEAAIEGLRVGGTIFICNGTYQGPLEINKSITIQGYNTSSVIINGSSDIICVLHKNVSIKNITILGDNLPKTRGVLVKYADNFNFLNNTIINCSVGLDFQSSNQANVSGNTILRGIKGYNCSCSENRINKYIGINLQNSWKANIKDNNIHLYGTGKDAESNLIGVQVDRWSDDIASELRELYATNMINGSNSCYRFWCTQGRKCIPNKSLGVF